VKSNRKIIVDSLSLQASLYKIKVLNHLRQHQLSAIYGLSPFADVTESEFETRYLANSERVPKPSKQQRFEKGRHWSTLKSTLAPKIDWREKGIISPVHYQGVCGACWAISVIETIESVKALQTNSLVVELSVQQMIDCAKNYNMGCVGGDTCMLLEWLTSGHVGIESRSVYPDRGEHEEHVCKNVSSPVDSLTFVESYSCEK
jgi:cathepsin O